MANLDEFVIAVKLETDKLNKDFLSLQKNFSNLSENLEKNFSKVFNPATLKTKMTKNEEVIKGSVANIAKILTGGLGAVAGIMGVKFATDFIMNATANAHASQFASKVFNTTPRNLQQMQQVYKRAGGSPESASADIANVYNRMNSQDPAFRMMLQMFKIKTDSGNRDPEKVLIDIINSLSNVQRREYRNSYAKAFGLSDSGSRFINERGSLNKYIQDVDKDLISNKNIEQLAEEDKRFQLVAEKWTNIQNTIAHGILPVVERFTDMVEKLMSSPQNLLNSGFNESKEGVKNLGSGILSVFKNDKTTQNALSILHSGIAYAETSGGNLMQKIKGAMMGAYGTYGLRLSTANDQLNFEKKTGKYAPNPTKNIQYVTPQDLMRNNYQEADAISERYWARLNKSYGLESAIKKWYGGTDMQNEIYKNKVLQHSNLNMQQLNPSRSRSNNIANHQVSYNVDSVHMHGVNDMKSFTNELTSLSQAAYSYSRDLYV